MAAMAVFESGFKENMKVSEGAILSCYRSRCVGERVT